MKKIIVTYFFALFFSEINAQISDTLNISREESEAIFLEKNLQLIAQKLEISKAEALVLQAKYWPNPTFSISEVNLWHTYDIEKQPTLIGNWGQNSQIAVEIEQVIQTAGKRRKNIELQKIQLDGEEFQFQEVLRELKKSLRNTLSELFFQQEQQKLIQNQLISIQKLTTAFQNQLTLGNISKSSFMRLKAQELEFKNKLVALKNDISENQSELKSWLMLPAEININIIDDQKIYDNKLDFDLENLLSIAKENRPDLLLKKNNERWAQKNLELQNAIKMPDVAVSINYDRGGNIMKDFVGVGLSFDLPFLNKNKGNIQAAKIEIDQSQLEKEHLETKSGNEIASILRNLNHTQEIYKEYGKGYESDLDEMLKSYEKNFRLRNLSLLEYLDFLDAYIENKTILFETKKTINQLFENLQYSVGKDL